MASLVAMKSKKKDNNNGQEQKIKIYVDTANNV